MIDDYEHNGTEYFFRNNHGLPMDPSVFADERFYQLLSCDLESIIAMEEKLGPALANRGKQGSPVELEIRSGVSLSNPDMIMPLNGGFTTEDNLKDLHDEHDPGLGYTYKRRAGSFTSIRFGFWDRSMGGTPGKFRWMKTKELFLARVEEIKEEIKRQRV